jgi:hypothetical protein
MYVAIPRSNAFTPAVGSCSHGVCFLLCFHKNKQVPTIHKTFFRIFVEIDGTQKMPPFLWIFQTIARMPLDGTQKSPGKNAEAHPMNYECTAVCRYETTDNI